MRRFYTVFAMLFMAGTAGYAYTNILENGTNITINTDFDAGGEMVVGETTSSNTLIVTDGGSLTSVDGYVGRFAGASSNTAVVSGSSAEWINSGTLYVGAIGNSNNLISVSGGGTVTAGDLLIEGGNLFNLDNGGTLAITGGFNASLEGFNWNAGGHLSVGGVLMGMPVVTNLPAADAVYLEARRALTIDSGGSLSVGENNLVVGFSPGSDEADLSRLVITNGGSVENADGYIGWGSSADQNSVVVGSGSSWANSGGGLYVGKYLDANTNLVDAGEDNSLMVLSDGWAYVGEGRIAGPSGGLVVASTNGAELVVGGNESAVTVEQGMYVGVDASTTGQVIVEDGATVTVGELTIATDSIFDLYGSLVISDFNAAQTGFAWNDGGFITIGGDLTGLDSLSGSNRTLTIDSGTWDSAAADISITGFGNLLAITNGGVVDSASAYIGVSSNDLFNIVTVGGDGSVWNLTDDLFIHSSNALVLDSTGMVSIAGNMTVSNALVDGSGSVEFGDGDNVLRILGAGSSISTNVLFDGGGGTADTVAITDNQLKVAGSLANRYAGFERLVMTNSLLGGNGTVDVFDSITLSGGSIVPDGDLVIDGEFTASGTTLRISAGEDSLTVTNAGAPLDLSGLSAEVTVSNLFDPSGFDTEILISADGFSSNFVSTAFIEPFLLYDFMLTNDSTSISVQSETVQDGVIGSAVTYSGIQGIRSGFNGMQNALFVRTKQLRRNAVATDDAISSEAYLIPQTNAPSGPSGPGDKNTIFGLHFWAKQYSGQGDYDTMGVSDGFTLNHYGTSFGFDRLFGDSLVVGINYTYASSAARTEGGDSADTETYWLGLYGEWFSRSEFYLEGLVGYGWSDYTTIRTDTGYVGTGKFDGTDLGAHLEAGKYIHRGGWAAAPYVGVQYLGIESDNYTETEQGTGTMIEVDGQQVNSLESVLGIKLRNRFDTAVGRFQTAGYAEWVYDFINDDIGSTLTDGTATVQTARIAPGGQLFNTGVGVSWVCTEYLEVGIGYDGRFNEDYEEHTGSAMLEVRF